MSFKSLLEKLNQLNEGVTDADLDADSLAKHKSRLKREKTRMGLSMPKPAGGPRKSDVPAVARKARGEDPLSLKDLMEDSDNDSPVFRAIIQRIMMTKMDLLEKYGSEQIVQAAEEVSDWVGDVDEIGTSDVSGWVREVEDSLKSLSEATGRSHRGSYGSEYQGDADGDDDEKPVKRAAPVQRSRGRPRKDADNTGQVKKYDTETLSNWIIGNLPKKLPKGVSTTKHKLKDWMERVETKMLNEAFEEVLSSMSKDIERFKRTGDMSDDLYQAAYDYMFQNNIVGGKGDAYEQVSAFIDYYLDESLSEQDQVSIEPASTTAHVIKQGDQVLGQVDNPGLANTIKTAIGQGQMSLAGSNLKEGVDPKDGLQSILMLFPHEHKMCQDGWGMDSVFVDSLADYYYQAGKIPHSIWRGPVEQLHEYVQECYAKDTEMVMGEEEQLDEVLPAILPVAAAAGRLAVPALRAASMGHKLMGMGDDSNSEDDTNEAVDPDAVTDHSMTSLLKMLDEYVRDDGRERVEPILRKDSPLRTSGTRSDGSDRYEPRYTGPKSKASSLSRDQDSLRSDRNSTRYMEEENESGEHSPITGDEITTTPKPMKPLYPTGKENKMKNYDVVSDKMADKMMYEGKKQKYDKDYYDSIDAAKKDDPPFEPDEKPSSDKDEYGNVIKHKAKHLARKGMRQAVAEESTTKRDDRAERAGKRVAKDLEYDERKKDGIHGKRRDSEDAKAERAGRRVARDIEYDDKMNEAAKPDFLDLDKDGNKRESMKKAAADKRAADKQSKKNGYKKSFEKKFGGSAEELTKGLSIREEQIDEAFDDYETPKSKQGMFDGKTLAELRKAKDMLMKKEKRTKAEQTKVDQLNFAIRAKQKGSGKWGKVKKEAKDVQMETWEKKLSGMLTESVTVNTSTGTEPDTNSVNISATGEDADQLMAMLQNAGLHASPTTGGYQQLQYDSSEQVCEKTTDAEFMIPEDKKENESANRNTATYRNGKEYDGTGSPAVTTKTPGSDPHNKFDDAEDVPIMAMPRGMGVSQNIEDELAEVIEPVTPQDVIGELDAEDSANDDMSFIKKVINHGASQYGDSAPSEQDYADERMNEEDVEEGNEFSGELAKAKASGAKEFEVDGKKYPVKEEGEYWAEEVDTGEAGARKSTPSSEEGKEQVFAKHRERMQKLDKEKTEEGYEDANWAAMRSDDKIQDADAIAYKAGAATTNRDPNLNVTEEPEHGRKNDGDIADSTYAGKNRQGRVSEGEHETCNECGGMYEGDDHKCDESLNEWANSPVGQSEDEEFETDMEFMTKVISGGLNNMKQDQTTLPSTRVRTGSESPPRGADMSIGAELKRLAGIN